MAWFIYASAIAIAALSFIFGAALKKPKQVLLIPSLESKHVFITGASSGIGLAIAKQALEEGAFVSFCARNEEKLKHALLQLSEDQIHRAKLLVADVSDYTSISHAVQEANNWKQIDILVCNAGIIRAGYVDDLPVEDLQAQVNTNLLGAIHSIHAALPFMKARPSSKAASIVIMSSAASLYLVYGNAVYTATKYALKGLAECLKLELLPYNIHVNLVCPGYVKTPMLDEVDNRGELEVLLKKMNFYDPSKADTPEYVAECTLDAVKSGEFLTNTGDITFPLVVMSRGPVASSSIVTNLKEAFWFPRMRIQSFNATKRTREIIMEHFLNKPASKKC